MAPNISFQHGRSTSVGERGWFDPLHAALQDVVALMDLELFRFPLVIERTTYGLASVVVCAASIVSGLLVRRRLDELDLIAVLKSRE